MKQQIKFIQLIANGKALYALDENGNIHEYKNKKWKVLKPKAYSTVTVSNDILLKS